MRAGPLAAIVPVAVSFAAVVASVSAWTPPALARIKTGSTEHTDRTEGTQPRKNTSKPTSGALTPSQREKLRYDLENLWNEVDLAVRNHRADEADARRQEREMEMFRVFERIPMTFALPEFRDDLAKSADSRGLRLRDCQVLRRSRPGAPIPRSIKTHQANFKLTPEQLAEEIHVLLSIEGAQGEIERWINTWTEEGDPTLPSSPRRIVRVDRPSDGGPTLRPHPGQLRSAKAKADSRPGSQPGNKAGAQLGEGRLWQVHAVTYRYRDIHFPKLLPRDPLEILPAWAKRQPASFARTEPELWNFVTRIQSKRPEALPLYSVRERFLLNAARLTFFLQHFSRLPSTKKPA